MELEKIKHKINLSKDSIDYVKSIINKNNLKNVLEIGTLNGYSAIHFSTVAESVKTIEINKECVGVTKENFKKFNIKNIKVIEGDAKEVLKNLNEKFDLIFIDAMKREYKDYLVLALKLIDKGFIYADNTISHKINMEEFFEYLGNSNLDWKELGIGKGLVEIKVRL